MDMIWWYVTICDVKTNRRYHELGVMWWIWEAVVAPWLPGAGRCLIGREKHSSDFQRNTHQKLEESYQVSGIKLFRISDASQLAEGNTNQTLRRASPPIELNMRRKVLGNCREKYLSDTLFSCRYHMPHSVAWGQRWLNQKTHQTTRE